MLLELIDEAVVNGAPLHKACATVGLAPTTIARWRARLGAGDGRRGPKTKAKNALSDTERAEVVELMNTPEHSSMSPSTLVPMLATLGIYVASESTFYRIARDLKLLQSRGRARPPSHRRPREFRATGPNQVWAWDITFLPTEVRGRFLKLYVVLDVWSRMIVGAEVHAVEDASLAAALIESCCRRQHVTTDQLVLHSDNGAAMKGNTMLAKLQQLGVMPSFSRPSVSDDNAFAESVMRTIKYNPAYPDGPFVDLAEARAWVETFVAWYNDEHLHSGIRFVTPTQRHLGLDVEILAHRHRVYTAARTRHPERWTGPTRNWARPSVVVLNPEPERAATGNEKMLQLS
jgi:putative transposase